MCPTWIGGGKDQKWIVVLRHKIETENTRTISNKSDRKVPSGPIDEINKQVLPSCLSFKLQEDNK